MYKYLSLFAIPKPKPKGRKLMRELRRLVHQRNYWRNRTKELRGRRRR
jgi:hypothetical protein